MHELGKKILEPKLVPMQIEAWSLQGVFKPKENSDWKHDNYYHTMKTEI